MAARCQVRLDVGKILGTNLRDNRHHEEDPDALAGRPDLDGQSTKALLEGMKPLLSSGFGRAAPTGFEPVSPP